MAAPRPLLIVSDGGDWTRTVDKVEYPFIKKIYSFYGKEDMVENVHLSNEKHDFGPSKRQAMYDFMARYLQLDNTKVKDAEDLYDETIIEPVEWNKLIVFPDNSLPQGHLKSVEEIYNALTY